MTSMVGKWLVALADGARLRCPACRTGRMAKSFWDLHAECPHCGVSFEPNEGDFLGAMVVAYSVLSVLVVAGISLLVVFTDLSAWMHVVIWNSFALLFILGLYRNLKGIWIGVLYAMTGLQKKY